MKTTLRYIVLTIMMVVPSVMSAQFSWDWAGVEAMIDDHKGQRSLLTTRAVLEQGNKLLHGYSEKTNEKYRDMNVELDKYTKAFDVIDIVFNVVSTGFNVYHTADDVSEKIGKYRVMLSDFNEKIIRRGKIEPVDTLLITINESAINDLYTECQNIYASVVAIAAYSSGQLTANVSNINLQVKRIDECLNRIRAIVNRAYFETYTYIRSRLYMWNKRVFTEKSKLTIANEAFGRWRTKGKEVKPKDK